MSPWGFYLSDRSPHFSPQPSVFPDVIQGLWLPLIQASCTASLSAPISCSRLCLSLPLHLPLHTCPPWDPVTLVLSLSCRDPPYTLLTHLLDVYPPSPHVTWTGTSIHTFRGTLGPRHFWPHKVPTVYAALLISVLTWLDLFVPHLGCPEQWFTVATPWMGGCPWCGKEGCN